MMFFRDVASANDDNVIDIFSRAEFHPKTIHAARQRLTIVTMVAIGLGVSLVPRMLARSRVQGVKFMKISGEQVFSPAILVWNPAYCLPTLRGLIEYSKRMLNRKY
jgi:DNA-binding transcriptional LysR family regulator